MSYDAKCHELAVAFLTNDPDMTDGKVEGKLLELASADLAQKIQDLIEGFLEFDLVEIRKGYEGP